MAATTTRTSTTSEAVGHRSSSFRPDIEGLRALAIIPVLVFHAHEFLSPTATGPLGVVSTVLGWIPGGYLGVDVFFVISGFLITGLLVRESETTGRVHFGRFYARRARRILPAASVTLLVTLVASYLILPAARAASTAIDVLWAALFNADVHFANSGIDYMGVATDPSPVLHFWSLNDEEKFYVVWPVVLLIATLVAHRVSRRHLRPALFVALSALAIPSLLWSQHLVSSGDNSAYFSALSRAFELAAGGLLAIAMPAVLRAPRAARVVGAIVGFVAVVWCMATYTTLTPFPGVAALPVVIGTVLIMAGHESGIVSRGLSTAVPRWFGRVSYSLYLWHWPVFVLGAALTASGLLTVKQALLGVVASILLAWVSYRVVEQPPQRTGLLRPTSRALWFGLVLIVTTCVAAVGVGRLADAKVAAQYQYVTQGLAPVQKADTHLLYIGDSITNRGQVPLEEALGAAGWDATVDALGGRPIVAGARKDWTPLCVDKPMCGADLVLAAQQTMPGTVVVALGTNSFNVEQQRVQAPTATDSGMRNVKDAQGHYVITGQDPASAFAAGVDRIMAMVPATTTVYWVGMYLDDAQWAGVHWRDNNAAIKKAVAKHPNAKYLDYAAYAVSAKIPYMKDGSHPTPKGMGIRAHWIVSQLG
ncbi:MAG TPA: acyltransferase family protein [Candidatus Nanopelagicales bacterium]|nr:acyltransferase family protein [Candidatus Nanopelagicales bacterium]